MLNALRVKVTPRSFQRNGRADLHCLFHCFPQRNFLSLFSLCPDPRSRGGKVLAHSSPSSPGVAFNSRGNRPGPGLAGCRVPGAAASGRAGGRVRAPRRRRQRLRAEGGGPAPGAGSGRRQTPSPRGSPGSFCGPGSPVGPAPRGERGGRGLCPAPGCPRVARPPPAPSRPHLTEKMSTNSILHFLPL